MKKWLFLAGAILTEVTATLCLKGALNHPGLYVVVVMGYLLAFICLDLALRQGMHLGTAYGIWGALGVASTAVLSAAIFGESLTPLTGFGIMLIIGGVLVVETGSQKASAQEIIDTETQILKTLSQKDVR